MEPKLLLSSAVGGLQLEKGFILAKELGIGGLELLAFKWTKSEKLKKLSEKYSVPIDGVHFPFWWETKSLRDVLASEDDGGAKFHAIFQYLLIGSGNSECSATIITRSFGNAYCLLHPDVYHQLPNSEPFEGREVYFENERPKKGEREDTYNPYAIQSSLVEKIQEFNAHLMFDPRHIQISQDLSFMRRKPLHEIWADLKPAGLHFSFRGEEINDLELPRKEVWKPLSVAILRYPPKYIVLEIGRNKYEMLSQGRNIIKRDLGI